MRIGHVDGCRSAKRIAVPGGYWPGIVFFPTGRRTTIDVAGSIGASVLRFRCIDSGLDFAGVED